MGLVIHKEVVTKELGEKLKSLCPFGAISYDEKDGLSIGMGCKLCKLCVKKGDGAVTFEEEQAPKVDKSKWNGVLVFCEHFHGKIHNVTFELLGKARELAAVNGHKVLALMIGSDIRDKARELFCYGADEVYVYDDPGLKDFLIEPYTNVFYSFIQDIKPSSILVGATNVGRSLAPRVAARLKTGLTADCTSLEMTKDTDLVQIRPAFGGNIMARIMTPNHRPQFCTVRYKIFSKPERIECDKSPTIMEVTPKMLVSNAKLLDVEMKPEDVAMLKSMLVNDLLLIIKQIHSDILAGKQISTLLGASSVSKSGREACQKLQLPYRMAMMQQQKSGYISKDRMKKIQDSYVAFTGSLVDEVFGGAELNLKEPEEGEEGKNEEGKD